MPTSAGYISQIKLAYTYDGAFVGRLVFDLKANATAAPVSYSCGSAGGKAVDLLPSKGAFVVTKVGVGCAPLPSVAAGSASGGRRRRRSLSAAAPGTGLSARGITVAAAALASLPIDPATGVPETPQLGDVIAPQDEGGGGGAPTPVPTPTSPPTPPPTTPPPAPVVTPSSASLDVASPTLVISGANFDPSAAGNVVTLGSGATGTVTAASSTSLTITFSTQPSAGALSASVTSFGRSSGAPVQVANVVLFAWAVVGSAGFSAGTANYVSLALDSTGMPFVAYADVGNANKATVQKLVGGTWTVVGTAGFSAGTANYVSLALDSTGTPIVAYEDGNRSEPSTPPPRKNTRKNDEQERDLPSLQVAVRRV